MDETLLIHQNDIIYNEPKTKKMYRLESGHIKMITYDYQEVKKFFGLKKELIEVITIDVDTEATELSGPIILREDQEPDFRKYIASFATLRKTTRYRWKSSASTVITRG